jgi:predicted metal-dependent phosphoesterase TrpH
MHSSYSDGSLSPFELVHTAKALDLYAIALTDHDTIEGVPEFMEEGKRADIITIPGLEISAESNLPAQGELHILGLFIDYKNKNLIEKLQFLQEHRNLRARKMIDKFKDLGIVITDEELLNVSGAGSIGRPHFAKILKDKGIVKSHREAFQHYLRKDRPAYVDKIKFPEAEAIELIKQANGLAVLAHPHLMRLTKFKDLEEKIVHLRELGLGGLEAYYPGVKKKDIATLIRLAEKYNLGISGGSDYHGGNREGTTMGRGYGDLNIPNSVYHDLLARWEGKKNI